MTEWDLIYRVLQDIIPTREFLQTILVFGMTVLVVWQLLPERWVKTKPLRILGKAINADSEKRLELQSKALRGIGHDLIVSRGKSYLKRGWISPDEYENLYDYLFIPYQSLGGNGTAFKIMEEVKRIPTMDPEE